MDFTRIDGLEISMNTQSHFATSKSALLASLLLCCSLPMLAQAPKTARRDANPEVSAQIGQTGPIHIVPMVPRSGEKPSAAVGPVTMPGPQGAQLLYYGGQVVSNIQIVVVYWGPNVDPIVTSGIAGFYQTITNSPYFDLLSEYSTAGATVTGGAPSTNQKIGRGTYLNSYTITPSVCPSNCTIDDSQISPEVVAQINAGHLPQPTLDAAGNDNTLYMIYFPPGVVITQGGGTSCVQFCAYHGTVNLDAKELGYGVVPDFGVGSGCDLGCGSGTQFENVTAVSSHEMAESVTDLGVGLAGNTFGPPLAWYDTKNGEVGDICAGNDVMSSGYSVQLLWSNMQNACVDGSAKFQTTAPSTATAGTPFTLTLTAQDNTGATLPAYTGKVHFTSSDPAGTLPADYTFSTSDNGTHTFNVTLQTSGAQTVTVTDTVAAAVTGVTGAITVSGGSGGGSVTLNPGSLSFGNQNVGTTSAAQTVTLTNGGTASLSITNISATGDFAQTHTCGASLAVNASCTISVTFTPTTSGTRTGTLTVSDNSTNSPQTASLGGTGVVMGTDQLVLVTSQAAQGANDSVTWKQLGADGTLLAASLSATSVNGLSVTGSLAGPNSVPAVVCSATVCSWTGTGFPAGDTLIWTSDAANGGNGPLTVALGKSIAGGGALIQADAPGQFTAQIQAYNGATLLGTFTVTSDANGDPAYIGVQDQTGPNITSLTFSLTNCASACTDFALDTTYLNESSVSNNFPLTVTLAGSGTGTVTSTPAGISCPGTCSANFASATSVTLTETPAAGSTFAGWSGACSGTSSCSISMTAAESVTASFQASSSQLPLSVSVTGSGAGTVTSTPAGINCPGTCSANFNTGTSVTLTETPAAGSTFAGWSGACSGTGSCSISMTAAESVTANFQSKTVTTTTTLTVSSAQANAGSSVTFTAKVSPASGNTTPTGSVTFNNGATSLGTAQLSNGTAALTTSSLTAGTYSVTAAYSGDPNSAASSSAAVSLMVVDFTVAASQTILSVVPGQSVQTSLTVTPEPMASFSPTVTFSCSGLPSGSTCTFNPSSVTPNGASLATTLTIQTTAPSARMHRSEHASFGHGSGLLYALLLPGCVGILSMKRKRIAANARFLGLLATLTLSMICWTACGSVGITPPPPPPPVTASVTITATSSGATPISHQVVIQLTVQ